MTQPSDSKIMPFAEFVALLALCMSLVAMSIDSMLPALPQIGDFFGVERVNSQQFMITFLFAGLSIGQIIAGPLSDTIGRKRSIYVGLSIFIVGCLMSYFALSYEMMLVGRFVQGIGAAAPRVVTTSIVRDRYEGRDMGRVMSYIMGVFILVPALAPTIGQGLIYLAGWHFIFLFFIIIALIAFTWLATRMQETLHPEDRRAFTLPVIWDGVRTVCTTRMTVCYMIAAGLVFGAFIGYLNSSQQVFQDYYDVGELFPIYFGVTALAIGVAFFVNAQLIKRYGMRKVVFGALVVMAMLAAVFFAFELATHGVVPIYAFMAFIMSSAFCMGMLFGNFNALAMVPMGHMAGVASAVIGCVSLVVAVIAGGTIGQLYNQTLYPITCGFLILSFLSMFMMHIAEEGDEESGQG